MLSIAMPWPIRHSHTSKSWCRKTSIRPARPSDANEIDLDGQFPGKICRQNPNQFRRSQFVSSNRSIGMRRRAVEQRNAKHPIKYSIDRDILLTFVRQIRCLISWRHHTVA
jgi:hypothetical protein